MWSKCDALAPKTEVHFCAPEQPHICDNQPTRGHPLRKKYTAPDGLGGGEWGGVGVGTNKCKKGSKSSRP